MSLLVFTDANANLTALSGLSTTGLVARTGSGTAATRTITGTANQITVTNGDGVAGNPTLALPQDIATASSPTFAGMTMTGRITSSAGEAMAVKNTTGFIGFYDTGGATLKGYLQYYGSTAIMRLVSNTGGLELHANGANKMAISSSGALRLYSYGAGTLVTDSSGNVTASSDASLKTITGTFTCGLADVLKLTPRTYHWNEKSGMDTEDENVGFIAQEVLEAIPEAVGQYRTTETEIDGKKTKKREKAELLTLSDRPLIAALVNAVRELNENNTALEARVAALENGKASK